MSKPLLLFVAIATLLLIGSSTSPAKVGELYVLQAPNVLQDKIIQHVSVSEIAGVLGHFMGVASSFAAPFVSLPAIDPLDRPLGHLLVVVEDATLNEQSQLTKNSLLQHDIVSGELQPHTWLLSRLLNGAEDVAQTTLHREPAALQDAVAELLNGHSLVVSAASDSQMLWISSLHDELLLEHPDWKAYSVLLDEQFTESKTAQDNVFMSLVNGLDRAPSAILDSIRNADGTPVFDLSDPVDRTFSRELSSLVSLVPLLSSNDALRALVDDQNADLFTFVLSGLKQIRLKYGESSLQYRTAWAKLNTILPQVTKSFANLYKNAATASVILMDHEEFASSQPIRVQEPANRARRALADSSIVSLYTCYNSSDLCKSLTGNCSNNAECGIYKQDLTNTCYRCLCGPNYAGETCQYQDISAIFWIMVFLTLVMVVILLSVAASLAYMDPGTNTLLFRTGQTSRPKTE